MVKWSYAKERTNERGPYMLVRWSCVIKKRNKSMRTIVVSEWLCTKNEKEEMKEDHIFCLFIPGVTQRNEDVV